MILVHIQLCKWPEIKRDGFTSLYSRTVEWRLDEGSENHVISFIMCIVFNLRTHKLLYWSTTKVGRVSIRYTLFYYYLVGKKAIYCT